MARVPAGDRARRQAALLCLHRMQKEAGVQLPAPVLSRTAQHSTAQHSATAHPRRRIAVGQRQEGEQLPQRRQRLQLIVERTVRHACRVSQAKGWNLEGT